MISKVTPTIGNPETETVILDIDTSGTFDLDTTNNTIQFNVSFGDFLSGTFNITTFNETVLVLYQETEETEDPITTEMETTISFARS
jgi:stringent starvation protein B